MVMSASGTTAPLGSTPDSVSAPRSPCANAGPGRSSTTAARNTDAAHFRMRTLSFDFQPQPTRKLRDNSSRRLALNQALPQSDWMAAAAQLSPLCTPSFVPCQDEVKRNGQTQVAAPRSWLYVLIFTF